MNDVEKLRKALEGLRKNRAGLEYVVECRFDYHATNFKGALDKVNLDDVNWEYFKPENSKCLLSQDELKNIRKELRETIDTIVYDISELKCLIEMLEDMYNRVDISCMD